MSEGSIGRYERRGAGRRRGQRRWDTPRSPGRASSPRPTSTGRSVGPPSWERIRANPPGNLFDQDPLSYVIGRLNGFPTSFMHRGYHLSRVPTLGHKTRVAADCTMALLFGREVVSLGQVEHPRWEWESAALAQASGPRLVQSPRVWVGEEGA